MDMLNYITTLPITDENNNPRLEYDNVRIEPNRIHFEGAYDGKVFLQKITIQNCGVQKALVKVGQPSEPCLILTPVKPRDEILHPGLVLKRTLKYVCNERSPIYYATIPIFINKQEIILNVEETILCSELSTDKHLLDFGEINLGLTLTPQTFTLTNSGSSSAKFVVDAGQYSMQLSVSPQKGTVEPHSSVEFSVKVISVAVGRLNADLWIKCDKPIRIQVAATTTSNLQFCDKTASMIVQFLDRNSMANNKLNEKHSIQKMKNILVIYTGGSIGMKRNENGVLEPAPNQLEERIQSFPELHNRKYLEQLRAKDALINEKNIIVIPNIRNQYTVVCQILEYKPLLDSSNMNNEDWVRIVKDIDKWYNQYNAFVILHGTDTLSYTGGILSFMLENLGKPVILTGAMTPIFDCNSDAKSNFLNSIVFATMDEITEVCICFARRLLRANRAAEFSSTRLDAYTSPNYPDLGRIDMLVKVDMQHLLDRDPNLDFRVHTNLSTSVRHLFLHPLLSLDVIKQHLQPPTKGLVLSCYGYGNIPTKIVGILEALERAVKIDGLIIVNVTQAYSGAVGHLYATGKVLGRVGVISGNDMTVMAALVKLSYVLGRTDWTHEEKIEAMKSNLCGEMTVEEDHIPS